MEIYFISDPPDPSKPWAAYLDPGHPMYREIMYPVWCSRPIAKWMLLSGGMTDKETATVMRLAEAYPATMYEICEDQTCPL